MMPTGISPAEYATTPEAAQRRHDEMQHKANVKLQGRQGTDSWEDPMAHPQDLQVRRLRDDSSQRASHG